ncbi:MAG: hypothetical protein M3454_09035 [Actinomycetota bacterium]|nr:hypothetical protein [Actinomycetota bacterium]
MAHIIKVTRKGKAGHAWKVRYRDPGRAERARTFAKKADAERFAASIETDKARGEYIDPRSGKVTVAEWSEDWLQTKARTAPKTFEDYASVVRRHVVPRLGTRQLASRHLQRRGDASGKRPGNPPAV